MSLCTASNNGRRSRAPLAGKRAVTEGCAREAAGVCAMQLGARDNHYGTKSDGRWGQEPQDTWRCSDCGIMGQWKSTEPAMCGPWPPIPHFSKYTAGTDFGSATGSSRPCKWCSKTESEHFDADKFCSQFEYQYGEFCCICYAHRFGCDQWCGQVRAHAQPEGTVLERSRHACTHACALLLPLLTPVGALALATHTRVNEVCCPLENAARLHGGS